MPSPALSRTLGDALWSKTGPSIRPCTGWNDAAGLRLSGHVRARAAGEALPPDRVGREQLARTCHLAAVHHWGSPRFCCPHEALTAFVLWRVPLEREVDDELRLHIEMRTRELVARGIDPAAARDLALRRLGDVVSLKQTMTGNWQKERPRDAPHAMVRRAPERSQVSPSVS